MRLLPGRRAASRSRPSEQQVAATWQCASVLLRYPDDSLVADLPVVTEVVAALPESCGGPLLSVARDLAAAAGDTAALRELQSEYVDTFDSRRRSNLYLTYFRYGDTRRRGAALLAFKQAYRAAGFALPDSGGDAELPDHLCVVLEFGAIVDLARGRELLLDHRAGLELLRIALRDSDSRWAPVLEAVSATLPALGGDEDQAIRRLAAEGPPDEEVGMSPYALLSGGPAGSGPDRPPAGGTVDLPMPTLRDPALRDPALGGASR